MRPRFLTSLIVAICLALPTFATDLSITAANVKLGGSGTKTLTVTFGETATAGQVVYRAADGDYDLADSNGSDLTADAKGIVLVGNSADGVGVIVTEGPIVIGATTAAGMNYVLSDTAGGIAPVADLGSAEYIVSLGHATTTSVLWVDIKNYEALKP